MEYFVSPDGVAGNDGSAGSPWPLTTGISALSAGDILYLRQGSYLGPVKLQGKQWTPANPVVIRSFPGEHATIDGTVGEFRTAPNGDWVPGQGDEYISAVPYDHGGDDIAQGAFLGPGSYTRLITYSTLEDLQAPNQLFGPIADSDPLPGPTMVNRPDPELPRRPWVYMGPGLFQDESGYIHIRLSSTSNDLPGFPGYRGETDPRQVPLTIWTSAGATLLISDCASVYLTDLSVRGGSTTIHIEDSDDIRLDHVSILAGSYGVYFGASCHGSVMTHCLVEGGMPPWYFRSDRKDGYTYPRNGAHAYNGLGEVTMRALMHGAPTCTQNRVSYCEFVNGHDLYMFGTELEFSRNWVSNLNDDAIFAETEEITDLRIAGNVIEQSLTAINFARKVAGNSVFVYRNLIDLRRPTASVRPQPQPQPHGGTQPLELGHLFKGTSPDGPLDLFHNTILVKDQEEPSSFAYFRSYAGESRRRAFNNIFVAIDGTAGARAPISWLPKPTWPAATDGNCYHKTGPFSDRPLLRQPGYNPADDPAHFVPGHDFQSLDERPCSAPTRQASRSARGAHASHGSIFLSRDGASGNSGAVHGALPHRAGHRAPGGRKRPGTTRCAGARPHRPVEPGALTVVVQRSTCPGKPRQDGIECPL